MAFFKLIGASPRYFNRLLNATKKVYALSQTLPIGFLLVAGPRDAER